MIGFSVFFGACDWRHGAWQGRFYPQDMPADWWLGYYSGQFRTVFLPRAAWVEAAPDTLRQWAGETDPRFRFVLEASGKPGLDARAAEALGERLGLLVPRDDPRLIWFSATDALRPLAAEIQRRAPQEYLYLISRDADLERLEAVGQLIELLAL